MLLPNACGITVTSVFVLAAISLALSAGLTVATDVVSLVFLNLPAVLAFSLNVLFTPTTVVPLVGVIVIVGVAFSIEHLNVLVADVLSLHLYPDSKVAVIVYSPAFVPLLLLKV